MTRFSKAGFGGDEPPHSVALQAIDGGRNKDPYIGAEACAKAGTLILTSTIEHAFATDRDDEQSKNS
jgi:hypothetical protein